MNPRNLALAVALCLLSTLNLDAAESQTIVVTGSGEAEARPTRIEIDLLASGAAPLTGDAVIKHRDAVRRTTEAFTQLQNKDLTIESRSLSISGNKTQFDISRSLRLGVVGIDKVPEDQLVDMIAKFLDVARDAGVAIGDGNSDTEAMMARFGMGEAGTQSVVTFVVDDAEPVREQAYQKAFEQARVRAARVAKLAGGELGAVTNVEEIGTVQGGNDEDSASRQQRLMAAIYGIGTQDKAKKDTRLTSKKFEGIPVQVTLRVRFEMQPKGSKP